MSKRSDPGFDEDYTFDDEYHEGAMAARCGGRLSDCLYPKDNRFSYDGSGPHYEQRLAWHRGFKDNVPD